MAYKSLPRSFVMVGSQKFDIETYIEQAKPCIKALTKDSLNSLTQQM